MQRIDSQLDKLQLSRHSQTLSESPDLHTTSEDPRDSSESSESEVGNEHLLERIVKLQAAIKAISTLSSARAALPGDALLGLLEGAELLHKSDGSGHSNPGPNPRSLSAQELDLQWLLVSKAATQAYGLVLNLLLDQTIPLSSDIYYWNEVLGSTRWTGLYTIQTSPIRLWVWTTDIYQDARNKIQQVNSTTEGAEDTDVKTSSMSERWRRFYGLVKESVRERSLSDVQSKIMTPFTRCQMEAKAKVKHLKRLREMSASGLGVLMDEGMMFDAKDDGSISSKAASSDDSEEWKMVVAKSVTLMESILRHITALEMRPADFEETVFMNVDEENGHSQPSEDSSTPVGLALRLQQILDKQVPDHISASERLVADYGRPSRLIRYWLPGLVLVLSSSTVLRILLNRRAEIRQWIQDLVATTIDFWYNWVVEPMKKVIGTIRHDKDSEIALMSKESLQGDKASLERMVVDFAIDNPNNASGTRLTEAEVAEVQMKVKEGDLTPVLRAYEKDLKKPIWGTLRGDFIRALLIQIQKTKVDVEVALGGIDNLLKSQELVFGFVGLTPGILVCLGTGRWLSGFFSGRRYRSQTERQTSMIRPLRNIDRILSAATPANNGMLSYKEHGLLLCEVHVLRQRAHRILPGAIYNEFLEEIHDLVDLRTGIDRQTRVVDRIRWAYSRWLS